MMKNTRKFCIPLLAALLLAGCASREPEGLPDPAAAVTANAPETTGVPETTAPPETEPVLKPICDTTPAVETKAPDTDRCESAWICGEPALRELLEPFDADEFFLVTGTFGEAHDPILSYYYYDTGIDGTSYKHRKTVYGGELGFPVSYGDILLLDGGFETERMEGMMATYTLTVDEGAVWRHAGSCYDRMEQRELTVESCSYDGSPVPGALFSCFTYRLGDAELTHLYYSVDTFGVAADVSIHGASEGDRIQFAMLRGSAILPLGDPVKP